MNDAEINKNMPVRDRLAAIRDQFLFYRAQHDAKIAMAMTVEEIEAATRKSQVNEAFAKEVDDISDTIQAHIDMDDQYHGLAMRTAAGPEVFHLPADEEEAAVFTVEFVAAAINYLRAATVLDRFKSRLFYGKDPNADGFYRDFTELFGEQTDFEHIVNPQLIHAVLGIATEGAELVEDLLKLMAAPAVEEQFEIVKNTVRESGDVDWYQELLAKAIGVPVIMHRNLNIARLAKRFPDNFTEEAAIARADEAPEPEIKQGGGLLDGAAIEEADRVFGNTE